MLRQVTLVRPGPSGGQLTEVFWIDNSVAVRGRRVVDEDGIEWTIAETYGARESQELEGTRSSQRSLEDRLEPHR